MKIYLNQKINSIPVVANMVTLLESIYESNNIKGELLDINDIDIRHLYDPVRDFLEYYNSGIIDKLTDDQVTYVTNALYKSKGSLQIFTILSESLPGISMNVKYNYPIIEVLDIDNIMLTDIELFVQKFTNALYYLLYFSEISITFKNLIMNINETLYMNITNKIIEFKLHHISNDSNQIKELKIS